LEIIGLLFSIIGDQGLNRFRDYWIIGLELVYGDQGLNMFRDYCIIGLELVSGDQGLNRV